MNSVATNPLPQTPESGAPSRTNTPRVWPAAIFVAAYWGLFAAVDWFELSMKVGFFTKFIGTLVFASLFVLWWLFASRVSIKDRLLGLVVLVGFSLLTAWICDPSMRPIGLLFFGLPYALAGWTIWLAVAGRMSPAVQRAGIVAVLVLVCAYSSLRRMDGVYGDQHVDISWRWSQTAEDRYLAARKESGPAAAAAPTAADPAAAEQPAEPLALGAGDWPGFRGPNRDSAASGVTIETDWAKSPPKLLWKHAIGPAWSSVTVIGDRLFTQEQRGDKEAVVCLDAASGREIWAHEDPSRFAEPVAGAGPRSTPTFDAGRLYTLGAKGVLNCLDAGTGKLYWSRDVLADSSAELPMWGYASSPLVTDGIVIVGSGSGQEKALLSAYQASTGDPLWTAPTGKMSYSSPHLAQIAGQRQLLFLSELGLAALDPATGKTLWEHASPGLGWRAVQPHPADDGTVLVGSEDIGLVLLDVKRADDAWGAAERWSSKAMKPSYNDFVVHRGYIYGFDGGVFSCVDLASGKRQWKGGRYGHGQVLLVSDQDLLLVLSETGEVVLLAANPQKLEELARVQAITGKTWNHPVVAHGRLYVRNNEEMACFDVEPSARR